ncbi:flagellar motor protein MotA [Lichenihabitans sp. Uapishka_5]|uniref:flagellar motor protein MotA n=1 Tax=Lichenihabitans sp. Uapishka_5 TaxID=3037302 RepID=UPI0029E81874|nr:flagellar motor protein MotA [Lichenihabitans sp. Uapishka_5]MDX7949921.1 flagellar motor protein MotA [Lichenihabitans sp. Uapishka_5]
MASRGDPFRLSSPRVFLVRMVVFLILVGFVALILYRQISAAFLANPALNGLIFGVAVIGIVLGLRQVIRLFREVRWVNALRRPGSDAPAPVLLAPLTAVIRPDAQPNSVSTLTLRAVLDAVGSRLDESRELARYLTGLLIFLGLLGTFWGLLETVGSISGVIQSMQVTGDSGAMFDDLKNGLAAPIAGMSVSFTSSLFGLSGSLVLGFLDLQAGQAQNRFFTELEDNLSNYTTEALGEGGDAKAVALPVGLQSALDKIAAGADQSSSRAATAAMANLAEGIQGLVQHMRSEQQLIRDWVETQSSQSNETRRLLERVLREKEMR